MVEKKLEQLKLENDDDETCRTFVLNDEDHTLGNALRYMIMKNPDVKFCGYSIPHPAENNVNLRIQTYGPPATEVLHKGLKDLHMLCESMLSRFETAVQQYKEVCGTSESTKKTTET